MDSGIVQFKVFLWQKDSETEVRRFNVDKDVVKSFCYLKEKLCIIFPSLRRSLDFHISWKDADGDNIIISSDDELCIAVDEMIISGCIKLHVNLTKPASSNTVTGPVHDGVMCDACDREIVGHRYQCLICPDFDLCADCEALNQHPEHYMLRHHVPLAPSPSPFVKRITRELRRFNKKWDHQMNKNERPHDRHCPSQPSPHPHHHQHRHDHHNRGDGPPGRRDSARCPMTSNLSWLTSAAEATLGDRATAQQASQLINAVVEKVYSFVDPNATGHAATSPTSSPASNETKEKSEGKNDSKQDLVGESHQEEMAAGPSGVTFQVDQAAPMSSTSKETQPNILMETDDNNWTVVDPGPSHTNSSNGGGNGSNKGGKTPTESPDQNLYPTLPLEEAPKEKSKVDRSLEQMLKMGFNNEGNILRQMLEAKNGNIEEVLEVFLPAFKNKN